MVIYQNYREAIFVGKTNKENLQVQWNWSANFIGVFPWILVSIYPLSYFIYEGEKCGITKAKVVHRNYIGIPVHVVHKDLEFV